ncbi:hypothetical protein JL721_5555 [Aureococcus anophagefferens]|nr:hypothetical protein JL721_5555 [Aureococcus anophagefferens]
MSTTATDGTVEITMTHAVTGEAASSWKHKAGRREGPEHYRFGDLTKTLVHKRLWDDAPLCRKLRELGLGRAEAGGAVEVDARTLGASLSERDAITCLRHADGVNGSLSKRPPLAMPRYCGSLDACDALRGAFDACRRRSRRRREAGRRAAQRLRSRSRATRRGARSRPPSRRTCSARSGEAALCGAAFFAFLADGERGDDFRELRYDRDAKSVDAVGRFRFRFRPGTPALDVLSHHETGAAGRGADADARDSALPPGSTSEAPRAPRGPRRSSRCPRRALPARDVIATLAAGGRRDDYGVVSRPRRPKPLARARRRGPRPRASSRTLTLRRLRATSQGAGRRAGRLAPRFAARGAAAAKGENGSRDRPFCPGGVGAVGRLIAESTFDTQTMTKRNCNYDETGALAELPAVEAQAAARR